jgi:hypothetical protein
MVLREIMLASLEDSPNLDPEHKQFLFLEELEGVAVRLSK